MSQESLFPADLERLRCAARKLLSRLESALEQEAAAPEGDSQERHDRVFGSKDSLTATLVTLTDLLLTLEKPRPGDAAVSDDATASEPDMLTAADAALV